MAPSALAQQLAALRPKDTAARANAGGLKNRASLLFTPSEAAELDAEAIHSIGLSGLSELQAHEPALSRFEKTLFVKSVSDFRREQQTAEVIRSLDTSIRGLLNAISPYFLLRSSLKVIEYLIRRYNVHEHNVDSLLECALPYHTTLQFVRLIQLTEPAGRWKFLEGVKKTGSPLSKTVLAQCSTRDLSVLQFVCGIAKLEGSGRPAVNLFLSVCAEVLSSDYTVTDQLSIALMPTLLEGLRSSKRQDFQAASYMVVAMLVRRATLSPEATDTIIRMLAQHASRSDPSSAVLALVAVGHFQRPAELSDDAFSALTRLPSLPALLRDASANTDCTGLLAALLPAMTAHVADGGSSKDLHEIITTVPVGGLVSTLASVAIAECLQHASGSSRPSSSSEYKEEQELCRLLRTLALQYPNEMDAVVTDHLTREEGDEEEDESMDPEQTMQLLSSTFRGTRHAPVAEGGTTMLLALEHPAAAVRQAAIAQLAKQDDGSGGGYAGGSLLRRVQDENEGVALAALGLASLTSRTDPEELFAALKAASAPKSASHANPGEAVCGSGGKVSEEAQRVMVTSLLVSNPDMAGTVASHVLSHSLVCKLSRKLNMLALKLSSSVQHPACAGLSNVLKTWRDKGGGKGEDKAAGLAELNIAVVKQVAENLSNDKTGSVAEAVNGSGSDMLVILVLGQATASQTGSHQLETAASLITALSRVVGTLRGVAPQVIKGSSKGGLPDAQSLGKRFFVPDSASLRAWRGLVDCVAAGMASNLQKPTAKTQEAHARLLKSAVSLSLSAEGLVGGIACMKALLDLQVMSPMHFLAQFWRPTVGGEARTRALYLAASIAQKGEGGVTAWRPVLPLVLAAVCDGDKAVRRAAVTWLNSAAPNRGKGGSKDKSGAIPDGELCAFMDALVESSVEMAVDRTQFSTFCQAILPLDSDQKGKPQTFTLAVRERIHAYLLTEIAGMHADDAHSQITLLNGLAPVLRPRVTLAILSPLLPEAFANACASQGASAVLCKTLLSSCFNAHTPEGQTAKTLPGALKPLMDILDSKDGAPGWSSMVESALACVSKTLYAALPEASQQSLLATVLQLGALSHPPASTAARVRLRTLAISSSHVVSTLESAASALVKAAGGAHAPPSGKKAKRGAGAGDVQAGGSTSAFTLGDGERKAAAMMEAIASHDEPGEYAALAKPLCSIVAGANGMGVCSEGDAADELRYAALASLEAVLGAGKGSKAASKAWEAVDIQAVCSAVRLAANSQGCHQALRVVAMAAAEVPKAVLKHMMPVFTYIGDNGLRSDDVYSFHVVEKALESIIPHLLDNGLKPGPLLQVFTDSFDSIPSHRRLRLFSNLLTILRPLDSAHVLASLLASGKGVAKAGGKQTVLSFMGAVYAQINPKVQLSSLVLLMGEVGQDGDEKDVIIMQILVKVLASRRGGGDGNVLLELLQGLLMLGMRGEDSEEDEVVKLAEEAGTLVSGMLSVSGFVDAITALVTGKDQYLKQRALQLLSSRMQAIGDAVPSPEQSEMLLTLLPPLKVMLAGKASKGSALLRQNALICVSLMAAKMGSNYRSEFTDIAGTASGCLDDDSKEVGASACACLASLTSHLGIAMLPHMTSFGPKMISMTQDSLGKAAKDEGHACFAEAGLSAFEALSLSVPTLISPYVQGMLQCILHPLCCGTSAPGEIGATSRRASARLASCIAPRTIVPAVISAWGYASTAGEDSACELLSLAGGIAAAFDPAGVQAHHKAIFSLLLDALGARAGVLVALKGGKAPVIEDYARVEDAALEAMGKLVLKLNESRFKPIFARLVEWGAPPAGGGGDGDAEGRVGRAVALCKASVSLCDLLKSISVPYFTHLLDLFVAVLSGGHQPLFPASNEPSSGSAPSSTKKKRKSPEASSQGAGTASHRGECAEYVLKALTGAFRHDTLGFMTKERFDHLLPAMVGFIEDSDPQCATLDCVDTLLAPALAQLAVAVQAGTGSDMCWQPLNRRLLNTFSASSPRVRAGAIGCTLAIVEKLGDEFVSLIPETVPALVEALEDADEEVEKRARTLTSKIEDLLGESLNDFLVST